jgi:hypothetical protein
MAFYRGPKVVTNGLVLSLDAANPKSYIPGSTTWRDLSGTLNSGTLVNGPTFSSANGGSIVFDGTNDYCETVSNPITDNSSFTLAGWFNLTTLGGVYRPLIDGGNLGDGLEGYTLSIDDSNRIYMACDAGYKTITTPINVNQWYYIVGVATFGTPYTINIYVNTNLGTTFASSNSNSMTNYIAYVRLGQVDLRRSTLNYVGNIAQTQIYNRALSQQEITQNYNSLKSRFGLT